MADDGISLGVDLEVDGAQEGVKLDGVLGKLDSTMKLLDFHLGHIEQNTRKVAAAHKHHEKEAEGLRGAFERLIDKGMEPFLHKAKEIAEFEFIRESTEKLIELPEKLAEGIADLGKEMVATSAKAERFEMSFRSALGDERSEHTLGYIEKISKHTEFTRQQLKDMSLDLAKAGYSGRGLGKAIEATIDLAALSPNPQSGAAEAISALERVKTTGRIEGRALRPFGIDEKAFYAELSTETGLGIKELKKRLEEGKVDIETTLNSLYTVITHKTGKPLGDAGADMENLMTTRVKNIADLKDAALERFKDTKAFQDLSLSLAHVFDYLDPTKDPGKRIFHDLELVFERLPVLIEMSIKALKGLGFAAGAAVGPVAPLLGGAAMLNKQQRAEAAETVKYGLIGRSKDEVDKMGFWGKLGLFSKRTLQIGAGIATGHHWGSNAGAGMEKGLRESAPDVSAAAASLGDKADKAVREKLDMHSPSRVFVNLGRLTTEGFIGGIEESARDVDAAIARAFTVPAPKPIAGPGAAASRPVIVVESLDLGGVHVTAETNASPEEIAKEVGKAMREIGPVDLTSAIEQMALQAGAAR